MAFRLDAVEVTYPDLCGLVDRIARAGGRAHLHTTPPGCVITGDARRGIVVEATDEGTVYVFYDEASIEARAKPLAVVLHGADSVPDDGDELEPASEAVVAMAERMSLDKGHFHILNPVCLVNPNPGRWTILFEDDEMGQLQQVSDDRPLADIRLVERLIYAKKG